jgi:hypothetical protein
MSRRTKCLYEGSSAGGAIREIPGGHKMKRLLIAALIVILTTGLSYAKAYEANKKAGDYSVTIKMDKDPLSVGSNIMEILITDSVGDPVKDAEVKVDYGMPALLGMRAMAYKAAILRHMEGYHTELDFIEKGRWYVNVEITRQGKTVTATFTFDVM